MPTTDYSNWAKEQVAKTMASRAANQAPTSSPITQSNQAPVTPITTPTQAKPAPTPAPGTQASAQAWINNSASGQGGLDAYTQRQNARYQTALSNNDTDLINKLISDSQRVGYGLNNPVQQTQQQPNMSNIFTPGSYGGYDPTAEEKAYLQMQLDALSGQSESNRLSTQYGIDQNAQYLQEQLAGLNQQHAVDNQAAQELQNRRGGFYSGGLDYQLGAQDKSYAAGQTGLTRDVASRNQQLLDQYGNTANTIAQQIQELQSNQPDILRNRIQEWINNERNYGLDYASQFGNLGGETTLAAQQQAYNQATGTKNDNWNAYLDATNLTGSLGNGPQSNWGNLISNANSNNPTYDAQQDTINNNFNQTQADIQNQQWQQEFNQRVQQDGIQNAIAWANNSVSQQNADRLSANANSSNGSSSGNDNGYYEATSSDMNTIYDTLLNQFSQYNDSTKKNVLTNDPGQLRSLINSILDFELPDDQTTNLLRRFGISQKRAEELLKSSSSSSNSSNSLPSSEQLMRDTLGL